MTTPSRARRPEILFVCTANACRSPMAEALLRLHLNATAAAATVASAGTRVTAPTPVTPCVLRVVPGLEEHTSRRITAEMIGSADLVLAMANEHLREIVAVAPTAFDRSFTLRDFVARSSRHGARADSESFAEWVAAVGSGRSPGGLVAPPTPSSNEDDIADPIGGTLVDYQSTAAELNDLLALLVELAWPPTTRAS